PALLLFAVMLLSACGERQPPSSAPAVPESRAGDVHTPMPVLVPAGRNRDSATMLRGAKLYQDNCAACHGTQAQGAPNWQKPGADGKYPAPPLNGTGHAWHHPLAVLNMTIKRGTLAMGGSMPAWEGKLSDDDIAAVIVWIQSRWPEEIYQSWRAMDEKARGGKSAN
ncbi:MAG: cytochrome c, partial [Gammaproteobacteria bacterium]|nr:cytochrome c [Gammaproteobacteria bacterium]